MPRKSEIQAEEAAVNSPLRRSNRKASVNSPAPASTLKTRHSSLPPETTNGNEKAENKAAARGRRGSSVTKETDISAEVGEKLQPLGRTRRSSLDVAAGPSSVDTPKKLRGRRNSTQDEKTAESAKKSIHKQKTEEESEEQNGKKSAKAASVSKEEVEEKPESVKTRSRRSSTTSETSQETSNPPVTSDTPRTLRTRRNSAQDNKTEETNEKKPTRGRRKSIELDKIVEAAPKEKKISRGHRASIEGPEDLDDKPNKPVTAKPKRRLSITENAVNLEPITEQETESASRKSTSPILKVNLTNITMNEPPKTDVNLSIINESVSEDVEEPLNKTDASPEKKLDQEPENSTNASQENTSKTVEKVENISLDSQEVSAEVPTVKSISNEKSVKDEIERTELKENESLNKDTLPKNNENETSKFAITPTPVVIVEKAEINVDETQSQLKSSGGDLDIENLSPVRKSPKLPRTVKAGPKSPHQLDFNEAVEHPLEPDNTNNLKAEEEILKSQPDEDSVFLDNSEKSPKNSELKKSTATISSGSDGSFNFKLNPSLINTSSQSSQEEIEDNELKTPLQDSQEEIETELNSSKASDSSDKENVAETTGLNILNKDKENVAINNQKLNAELKNETEVLKTLSHVTPQKDTEVTAVRVSNVFRPKNIDYSFVEPMDVDKTILSTTMKIGELDEDDKKLTDKSLNNTTMDDSFKLNLSVNQTHQEEVNAADKAVEVIENKDDDDTISDKKVSTESQSNVEDEKKEALHQLEEELLVAVEDADKTLQTPNVTQVISNPSTPKDTDDLVKQNETEPDQEIVLEQDEVKSEKSEDYEFQISSDEEPAPNEKDKEIFESGLAESKITEDNEKKNVEPSNTPPENKEVMESQEEVDENKPTTQENEETETSFQNTVQVEDDTGKKSGDEENFGKVENNSGEIPEPKGTVTEIDELPAIIESHDQNVIEEQKLDEDVDRSVEPGSNELETKETESREVDSIEEAEKKNICETLSVEQQVNDRMVNKDSNIVEISEPDVSDVKDKKHKKEQEKSVMNKDYEDTAQTMDTSNKEEESLEIQEEVKVIVTSGTKKKMKKQKIDEDKTQTENEEKEDLEQHKESKSGKRKSNKIKKSQLLDTTVSEKREIKEQKSEKSKDKSQLTKTKAAEVEEVIEIEDEVSQSDTSIKNIKLSKAKLKQKKQSLPGERDNSVNVTDETKLKKNTQLTSTDLDSEEGNNMPSKLEKDKAETRDFKGIDTEQLDKYLNKKLSQMEQEAENEDSEDEGSENDGSNCFIDDMAEEGEEDTPSEDSNQIIDEGESINTTDSEPETEDDYDDNDSFICDEEKVELLSGEEYDLDDSSPKHKKSRIINVDNIESDVIKIEKKEKVPTAKKKSRIIRVSISSDEEEAATNEDENKTVHKRAQENEQTTAVFLSKDTVPKSRDSTRKSSIVIQENIKVSEIQDAILSDRINRIVDSFCTTVSSGELSMNLSLEYNNSDPTSPNEEKSKKKKRKIKTTDSDKSPKKQRLSVSLDNIETSTDEEKQRRRKRQSQSLDSLSSLEVPRKKKKKNKKSKPNLVKEIHSKKIKKSVEDLQRETFSIMNQLITDVKNRPVRKIRPSSRNPEPSTSWIIEEAKDIRPSTSIVTKNEKKEFQAGKIHPKDFKNQMLYGSKHVRRVETKKLLAKKGAPIPF